MNNKDEKMIKLMKFGIPSLLVILILGVTIAYFSSRSAVTTRSVTTANIRLDINPKDATIIGSNLSPTDESRRETEGAKKTFTVTSSNEDTLYMSINLTDIVIDDELKTSSFMWELFEGTDSSGTSIASGDFNNVGESITLVKNIEINASTPKTYTIYVWIQNTEEDQNAMQEKTFTAKIEVVGSMESSVYKDSSGANQPLLAEGMIPVIYDENSGNWEVANTEEKWYSYNEQMWANAVTTSDASYRTAPAGTEIPMESINSMWVWIPRYKYRIEGQYGKLEDGTYGTQENPGLINVAFESGTNTTGTDSNIEVNSDYYTHPAFTFGDEKLEGIWVGKFETSGSTTTPIIKPGVVSLLGLNVKQFFETNLNFAGGIMDNNGTVTFSGNSTYGLTSSTDTHMMKNTEWGAVAYLSQSKYGKMGNPNYSSADKEIYINATYDNYVGYSTGGISLKPSGTNYFYNDRLCEEWTYNCTLEKVKGNGTGASTTGTVYGIYDMSGGGIEYVMANLVNNPLDSEFTVYPEEKYYDKIFAEYSEGAIKGHATKETRYWYQDTGDFVEKASPWFTRGGGSYSKENAGIFAFSIYNGSGDIFLSSRAILISS